MAKLPENLAIISISVRALAKSVLTAGISPPHLLTNFIDTDLPYHRSLTWIPTDSLCNFHSLTLLQCLQRLHHRYGTLQLLIGSGMESILATWQQCEEDYTLLGNTAAVVQYCKNPRQFFPLLAQLGIPYPESGWQVPLESTTTQKILYKQIGGSGGAHVQQQKDTAMGKQQYWQEWIWDSNSIGICFLADGEQVRITGICQHYVNNTALMPPPINSPFIWSGCYTGDSILSSKQRSLLTTWLQQLTRHIGLRGLCGADILQRPNGELLLLEINPRPPASFELYPWAKHAVAWHLAGCIDTLSTVESLPREMITPKMYYGMHHLFASQAQHVPINICWQPWMMNRSPAGKFCRAGEPLCTVAATGNDLTAMEQQLRFRIELAAQVFTPDPENYNRHISEKWSQ